MTPDRRFPELVSVACHDLLTPLATVYGFARTLERLELDEPAGRYVGMIAAASGQIDELVRQLRTVARIEAGSFEPTLVEADSLELARAAAEPLGEERVAVAGTGGTVRVERDTTVLALTQLFRAAGRHGGHDRVDVAVAGEELAVSPVSPTAAPVLLGEKALELGAPAAAAVVRALGGSLAVEDGRLVIRLAGAAAATS